MRKLWLLFCLPIVLGSLSEAIAQPPDVAGVLPGDRWVYDVTDEISGDLKRTITVVVIDVSDKEINARVSSRGTERPRHVVFDANWNRIDDDAWKYMPSDGSGVQRPLEVGKEWRFNNQAKNFSNGVTVRTSGHSKVVAEEKVTTSAGTFDTFKIETALRYINSNDQTKAATVNSTLWYAPAINRWVRKSYKMQLEGRVRESHTEDLTDFSRKP